VLEKSLTEKELILAGETSFLKGERVGTWERGIVFCLPSGQKKSIRKRRQVKGGNWVHLSPAAKGQQMERGGHEKGRNSSAAALAGGGDANFPTVCKLGRRHKLIIPYHAGGNKKTSGKERELGLRLHKEARMRRSH